MTVGTVGRTREIRLEAIRPPAIQHTIRRIGGTDSRKADSNCINHP